MVDVLYDSMRSCNRCGANKNKILIKDSIESIICECETTCTVCGFEDYWAYGFFESGQDGYDKALKYTNDKGADHVNVFTVLNGNIG